MTSIQTSQVAQRGQSSRAFAHTHHSGKPGSSTPSLGGGHRRSDDWSRADSDTSQPPDHITSIHLYNFVSEFSARLTDNHVSRILPLFVGQKVAFIIICISFLQCFLAAGASCDVEAAFGVAKNIGSRHTADYGKGGRGGSGGGDGEAPIQLANLRSSKS